MKILLVNRKFIVDIALQRLNKNNEFIPMSERQIIQPDVMFEALIKAVKQMKKKLSLHKKILNF